MRAQALFLSLASLATASAFATEPAAADQHITADDLEQTIHCHGNAVYIAGNRGRFTIEGSCSTVYVEGSRNWLEIQDADWIRTPGNLNSVLYLNPGTRVSDPGRGNSVAPKWQQ